MKMLQKNLSEDGAKGVMQVMDKNRSGGVTYKGMYSIDFYVPTIPFYQRNIQ